MIYPVDRLKLYLWTTLAGGVAGCVNVAFFITIPRSAFLAFVLARGLKRIYVLQPDGKIAGVHPLNRVAFEGMLAGLAAGIPLAAISWACYSSGMFKSSDLPGIEELMIAPPLPTLLACLVYGMGLYLACACRWQSLWQAWLMVLPTAALAGFFKVGFSADHDVFSSWFIIIPCGALPFCLLWLGTVFWQDPYARELRRQTAEAAPPSGPEDPRP